MDPVSAVTGSGADAQPTATVTTGTTTPDYEAFLRLLVTQMQHQDPLDPMNDTEYIAQLATFANVEQNTMTNRNLEAVLTAQALGGAGALIGRTVTTAEGQSGVVSEVQITAGGTTAILQDGTELQLGEGVTVS